MKRRRGTETKIESVSHRRRQARRISSHGTNRPSLMKRFYSLDLCINEADAQLRSVKFRVEKKKRKEKKYVAQDER